MAMEINSIYGSYTGSYANSVNSRQQTAESMSGSKTDKTGTAGGTTETGSASRKTAADELAYLAGKYSGYNFTAGVYQQGTTFGSPNTTNIMIDPRFLTKMANDPQLEAEYEKQISLCKDLDEQMKRTYAARGWSCECGTIIDKDGGMSGWAIVKKDPNAKSYLKKLSENEEEIREKNAEKKEDQKEIEEKRQADREERAVVSKDADLDNERSTGVNLDRKI